MLRTRKRQNMTSYAAVAVAGAAAGAVAIYCYFETKKATGFLAAITVADAAIGASNVLSPEEAKKLLAATPDALLLDVQDPGSETIPGSYCASLGTLPFKASTDLADFKDPMIADRAKDKLIIVSCGLGGQAKLGAKLLLDYGFTNVKTIDGGVVAYSKAFPASKPACKKPSGGG